MDSNTTALRLQRRIERILEKEFSLPPAIGVSNCPLEATAEAHRRAAGWLRAASTLPYLRRILATGRWSRSGRTWYSPTKWEELFQACPSPQRLERQLRLVRRRANLILQGWGLRCSWAALAESIVAENRCGWFLRRPGRAALLAAANTLDRYYSPRWQRGGGISTRKEAIRVLLDRRLYVRPIRLDEVIFRESAAGPDSKVVVRSGYYRILAAPKEAWLIHQGEDGAVTRAQIPAHLGAPCPQRLASLRIGAAVHAAFGVRHGQRFMRMKPDLALIAEEPPADSSIELLALAQISQRYTVTVADWRIGAERSADIRFSPDGKVWAKGKLLLYRYGGVLRGEQPLTDLYLPEWFRLSTLPKLDGGC